MAAEIAKPYAGPAFLAGGYRVFFFLGPLWALMALPVWLFYLAGVIGDVGAGTDMLQWHAHELVYGYGGAVVAGFALTAIPNWTGRAPVRGLELGVLAVLWLAARVNAVLLLFGHDAETARASAEIAFFTLFVALTAREVIAGGNKRNFKIIALFALLASAAITANLGRLDILSLPMPGWQAGLSLLLVLICVIGGRVIPAFTGNWMRQQGQVKLPTMFNKFDVLAIVAAAVVLVMFMMGAEGPYFVGTAGLAAVLHFMRLARWRGWMTVSSPIVFVLHVSYFWVPLGFVLLALSGAGLVVETTALHAWTVGGVGSTTLAVMSRAALGHAGLPLQDSAVLTSIYTAINVAALARVSAGIWAANYDLLVNISGVLWCTAFVLFLWKFTPLYFSDDRPAQG